MSHANRVQADEIDQLLRNAQLRDEMEPYLDESYYTLNPHSLPTPVENEFLASMLAWERAPIVPIYQWFTPPLVLPHPDRIDDDLLHDLLWDTVQKLFEQRVVLDFTDHLNDRELYTLIYRDILPSPEKMFDRGEAYLHWDCAEDPEVYLRYYASPDEREHWEGSWEGPLPPTEPLPHPRMLPRRPL